MKNRSITAVSPALRDDIADLTTYRALPTPHVALVDPFLFLNHHGHQVYAPHNHGLPFGPHPHRGFETVTFIMEGDIAHRDSGGHESVINAGGIQWMTAGCGIVHSETSSAAFKRDGGPMEILQLWVNLPARLKMSARNYIGLQDAQIPRLSADDGRVTVRLTAGEWEGQHGPVTPLLDLTVMTISIKAGGTFRATIAAARTIFFYLVRGTLSVNGREVTLRHLVEFGDDGDLLEATASEDALVLLCHAEPIGEPVVSYGPFVMNTQAEIRTAISDYQAGKFGSML